MTSAPADRNILMSADPDRALLAAALAFASAAAAGSAAAIR
jgi:hypothetical protein